MLKSSEFAPYAPLEIGAQVSINHCKSGKSNARLYIKRESHGILAYCFHCGERGFMPETSLRLREGGSTIKQTQRSDNGPTLGSTRSASVSGIGSGDDYGSGSGEDANVLRPHDIRLPSDSERIGPRTPSEVTIWLLGNGITWKACTDYGIHWSPSEGLILPMYGDGNLIGYQSRRFPSVAGKPKYLTKVNKSYINSNKNFNILKSNNNTLVIVEDYISAVRVNLAGFNSLPIYGSSLKDSKVCIGYTSLIWLDNDNRQVRMNSLKIYNSLLQYGIKSAIIHGYSDPKKYSDAQIKEIITNVSVS